VRTKRVCVFGLVPGNRFVTGGPRRNPEVLKVIFIIDRTPDDWEVRVQSERTKERMSLVMGPNDTVRKVIAT
jgi:hypothetical protein